MNCPSCGYEIAYGSSQCPICNMWVSPPQQQSQSFVSTPVGTNAYDQTNLSRGTTGLDYSAQYADQYNQTISSTSQYSTQTTQTSQTPQRSFSEQYSAVYDPTVKAQQKPREMPPEYRYPELNLSKYQKKGVAIILGLIQCIIGAIFGYILFDLFDLIPFVGIFIVYLVFVLPIIGTLAIGLNLYRPGGAMLLIGSALLIPIGLIGIYGGLIGFKMAKARDFAAGKKLQLGPRFSTQFVYPTKKMKIACVFLIIICFIVPSAYFSFYLSQPQLKIASDEIDLNSAIIEIKNVGYSTAKAEDIEVKVIDLNNKQTDCRWCDGDLVPNESGKIELNLNDISDSSFQVAVYYNGERTDIETYEMVSIFD
jgi:hypothetical protein